MNADLLTLERTVIGSETMSVTGLWQGFGAPVLAVCGFSGSGKTTLLEAAIARLRERGLRVAVVKHDAHGFEVDRPGKDSDRLFRAGATVSLSGPGQQFERRAVGLSLEATLARLGCDHDVLLVEGHKGIALPKVWMESADGKAAPESVTNIVRTLAWDGARLAEFMELVEEWLPVAWKARPVYGGVLAGGKSVRMGRPKQGMAFGGRTLGEIAVGALREGLSGGRVLGLGGEVSPLPTAAEMGRQGAGYERLPDAEGFAGPAAGLVAAHRWAPEAAWIVAACDHPWLRAEHIAWLEGQRGPGRWAVIPRQSDGHACPTLALYEPQALEALARMGEEARAMALVEMAGTEVVEIPVELADGWKNVNTQDELRAEEERLAQMRAGEER